jgi:hypothetical protein
LQGISVSGSAEADIAYLKAVVPVMRDLRVLSFGTTVLAEAVVEAKTTEPELTPDERKKLAERAAAERDHRLRYGASGGPRVGGSNQR